MGSATTRRRVMPRYFLSQDPANFHVSGPEASCLGSTGPSQVRLAVSKLAINVEAQSSHRSTEISCALGRRPRPKWMG